MTNNFGCSNSISGERSQWKMPTKRLTKERLVLIKGIKDKLRMKCGEEPPNKMLCDAGFSAGIESNFLI